MKKPRCRFLMCERLFFTASCQEAPFRIFCFPTRIEAQRSESGSNNKHQCDKRMCGSTGFIGKGCVRKNRSGFSARFQSTRRSAPFVEGKRENHHKKETGIACLLLMSGGFNPDILPWNPCTATACKFPAKNTRNFFEVLLTLFEPPAEFNADITRPAFGTHPAAILASVLLLSADR